VTFPVTTRTYFSLIDLLIDLLIDSIFNFTKLLSALGRQPPFNATSSAPGRYLTVLLSAVTSEVTHRRCLSPPTLRSGGAARVLAVRCFAPLSMAGWTPLSIQSDLTVFKNKFNGFYLSL